jgi:tripartite-type tricarboxylate transporter receptor subunit TctC
LLSALALAAAAPALRASTPAFPARSVRIVVPYSVGIGPDVVSRALGQELQRRWGQPVVIDNRPGASGIVAFNELRQTAADGHTLFVGDTGSLAVNPLIHATLPYDVARDVVPLTTLFRATFALHVGAKSRFHTLGDLLAQARRALPTSRCCTCRSRTAARRCRPWPTARWTSPRWRCSR